MKPKIYESCVRVYEENGIIYASTFDIGGWICKPHATINLILKTYGFIGEQVDANKCWRIRQRKYDWSASSLESSNSELVLETLAIPLFVLPDLVRRLSLTEGRQTSCLNRVNELIQAHTHSHRT